MKELLITLFQLLIIILFLVVIFGFAFILDFLGLPRERK
jgi:hypothetical protein